MKPDCEEESSKRRSREVINTLMNPWKISPERVGITNFFVQSGGKRPKSPVDPPRGGGGGSSGGSGHRLDPPANQPFL